MAKYAIYTRADGTEIKLRINAERAIELEQRLGASIPEKTKELDKISVAVEYVAAALPADEYAERKRMALQIYDEIAEAGGDIEQYQYLILDILVNAGFINGERVQMLKAAKEKAEALLAANITALQNW